MKNFKIIILIAFIGAAVFGVLVFSGMIPIGDQSGKDGSGGTVVLWGTIKNSDIYELIEDFNKANPVYVLKYVEKRADTFDEDLLEALASGQGPDIFLIDNELAYKYSNKILSIPYSSYPISTFKQTFATAGEVFLKSDGFLAFPLTVDPLMMYYNRGTLDINNIVYPPEYWDQFSTLAPILNRKDETGKIEKSLISFGQYANVTNAKDILSMLFMQTGNKIVIEKKGSFVSTIHEFTGNYSTEQILEFYTNFANPLKEIYSWNKSLPLSRDMFISGNLAFYFGFASELKPIIEKNPNLNFQITNVPQIRGLQTKITSAKVTGIAISSFSKNLNSSFLVANLLSTGSFAKGLVEVLQLPPARRDLLSIPANQDNAFLPIFYSSSLFARSWLDPIPDDSNIVFRDMVENVLSNNLSISQSVRDASSKINLLLMR
ncbi:MAG: extracellular solute-binding protein [Candidatus Paceibacterota bacterium]